MQQRPHQDLVTYLRDWAAHKQPVRSWRHRCYQRDKWMREFFHERPRHLSYLAVTSAYRTDVISTS